MLQAPGTSCSAKGLGAELGLSHLARDSTLNESLGWVHPLQHRDNECRCLPCPIFGTGENVFAHQRIRERGLLDGRRPFEAFLVDASEELAAEVIVVKLKVLSFYCSDILHAGVIVRDVHGTLKFTWRLDH